MISFIKQERYFLLRKLIHVLSGLLFIWIAGKYGSKIILTSFILIVVLLDLGRKLNPAWNRFFLKLFRPLLKTEEVTLKPAGATMLWTGLFLTYILFPLNVFQASGMVAVLADPLGAIGGRFIPSPKIKTGKSVAGTVTFFIITLSILWGYWNIPLFHSLLLCIILSAVELYSPDIIENMVLSLAGAFVIKLLYA
ncbi:MAG: hypothetical protein EH225_00710 [Calditrichaeota bacterium]|nr:hypothetical protein [Calditrichota bacterium]RQW08148.1 MAG: hypothetical protein EH225_00710 [Calditrichota bacterium]